MVGFESSETFSPSQVCDYLKQEIPTLSQDVLRQLEEDGEVFLGLNNEYLREVTPLLGDRLKIKRVIRSTLEKYSSVSKPLESYTESTISVAPLCLFVLAPVSISCELYFVSISLYLYEGDRDSSFT